MRYSARCQIENFTCSFHKNGVCKKNSYCNIIVIKYKRRLEMSITTPLKITLFALQFFLLSACAGNNSSQTMTPMALFENRCTKCHSLDRTYKNETAEYWTTTVKRMKSKIFSSISDEDERIILQYLIDTRTGAFKPENAEKK